MSDSPISHHEAEAPEKSPAQATDEQSAQMEQAYAQMRRKLRMTQLSENIKHKIMVLSGKGGVGKSTVATGLALSLAQQGFNVGLLDIDITGPNVPKMMGLDGQGLHVEEGLIHPNVGHLGVKVISMAFLLEDEDTPVVWRSPIKLGAIQQFIADVEWGILDYLVLDFPPGTSDEPLTVAQSLPEIDGILIVTTPQDVALLDSRKSISFAKTLSLPVLGVVENMSGFTVRGKVDPNSKVELEAPGGGNVEASVDEEGNWSATLDIFKQGGGRKTAEELGVPFLGALPFDPGVVRGGDDGVHRIVAEPEGESAVAFAKVVQALSEQLSENDDPGINII
ncbi:MAG: Mrp/NBP35 family ATP-binding protein [Candidatus Thalassarchaeaceae archaeon]|jgi:Mrp family chromosome partitioning ATPase|nr:Mrp/NBP35 family ATP-binding protein [Candidatus Thalassarchaeaceae archaeon]